MKWLSQSPCSVRGSIRCMNISIDPSTQGPWISYFTFCLSFSPLWNWGNSSDWYGLVPPSEKVPVHWGTVQRQPIHMFLTSMIPSSLSPSLPLSLKINKYLKNKIGITIVPTDRAVGRTTYIDKRKVLRMPGQKFSNVSNIIFPLA